MDILETIVIALSLFLVGFGIIALVVTWRAPELMDKPFFKWMLTGRLPATRTNRTLVAVWGILLGSYFLLSITEQRLASYIVFAAWAPLAVLVLKRSFQSSTEV